VLEPGKRKTKTGYFWAPARDDRHAYLANTLTAIVNSHKQSLINDLLPWNYVK
jgi:hypothetical protein